MPTPSDRSAADRVSMLLVACTVALLGSCRSSDTGSPGTPRDPHQPPAGSVVSGPDVPYTGSVVKGLQMSPHPKWVHEQPSSAMRKAQFALPRAEGDAQDASLVVYHFGSSSGGSKEANLERWASQFEQPDGRTSSDVLRSLTRKVNGLDVLDIELSGTYVAETAPGSGVRVREEGWRLLASIVDTPGGPYYVKLVGPGRTVERWTAEYRAFISGLRYDG